MEHKFKIGDVVKLNSGSPNLVVVAYKGGFSTDDEIEVQWLNNGQYIQQWTLPSACFHKPVLGE